VTAPTARVAIAAVVAGGRDDVARISVAETWHDVLLLERRRAVVG
jgi:hypothetical protein